MKKNRKEYIKDILNAVKSKQRSDEIREFGKPISWANVVRNRKKYTRKTKHRKRWTENL